MSWHLPWLRLHLVTRELLAIPASSPTWPMVKEELRALRGAAAGVAAGRVV